MRLSQGINGTETGNEDFFDSICPDMEKMRPRFFSQPVDPLSESDTLSPAGLDWYRAIRDNSLAQWYPEENRALETMFLCASCDPETNDCMNDGICSPKTGLCDCQQEFAGSMCERAMSCHEFGGCLNNGTCAAWRDYCHCGPSFFGSLCQFDYRGGLVDIVVDV